MEEEEFFESGDQESLKQYNDYNVGYVADGDIARLRSKFRVVSQSVQELEETLARLSKVQNESIQQLHQNMEIAMERSGKNVKEIADEAVIAKQKLSEVRFFDKLEPLHDRIWSMNLEIEQIEQEESMGFVHPDEVTELKAENEELKQNVFLAEQSMYELKDAFEEMQTKFHQNQEG
ncbi:uncharacterized protein LOC142344463 [Convolutriloba macropyga]|uniref:uncharacterized protein LOC142344463 n=1 Tax=Convolutriloba macropyga TaxID=536237 RepID=UPI003F51ADC8